MDCTAHPLRRDDAALRGFLVIFADLTEVQEEVRERQLVDSLSQLGELTAGVAHELRNSAARQDGGNVAYLCIVGRKGTGRHRRIASAVVSLDANGAVF